MLTIQPGAKDGIEFPKYPPCGTPHPASPAEQLLANRLGEDAELAQGVV